MPSVEAQTPAPNRPVAANDGAVEKIFSPRSAAALALSHFSQQNANVARQVSMTGSASAGSGSSDTSTARNSPVEGPNVAAATALATTPHGNHSHPHCQMMTAVPYKMSVLPMTVPSSVPNSARRHSGAYVPDPLRGQVATQAPLSAGRVCFPFPPHPAFAPPPHPGARMHHMVSSTPIHPPVWTPQHHMRPPMPPMGMGPVYHGNASNSVNKPPPPQQQPYHGQSTMMSYYTAASAANTTSTGSQPQPQQSEPPPPKQQQQLQEKAPSSAQNKTRKADESSQSLVTPTPKKPRTAEEQDNYNRKKKSLGVLAETFIQHFEQLKPGTMLLVDKLSVEFAVERRRIYDVINILESLRVVMKREKNAYYWMGTEHLPRLFALIQHDAICEWSDEAVATGLISTKPTPEEIKAFQERSKRLSKEEGKSLSKLSTNFLRCFLVGHDSLALPEAADKISGENTTMTDLASLGCLKGQEQAEVPTDPRLFHQAAMRGLKKKLRRYYDLANVFCSVGILEKMNEKDLPMDVRRPRYRWNFRMSAKEILDFFPQVPKTMVEARTPFEFDCSVAGTPVEKTPSTSVKTKSESSEKADKDDDLFSSIHLTGGALPASVRRVSLPSESGAI